MPAAFHVKGYREFVRACSRAEKKTNRLVRRKLREAGEIVAVNWRARLSPIDSASAAGLRPRVRQRGVSVEQTRRTVTGRRPDYGALQMRRGVAALEDERENFERAMERALDEIADELD